MPIKTNLGSSPYFGDYTPDKNYHELLFKPSVAVQVRELNNLQAQLQNQIEKFGDNIFKAGTIVNGCNFSFYPNYAYIKIKDNNIDGASVVPQLFEGLFVETDNGLKAYVINSLDGFEASDPNLKTLYIAYSSSDIVSGNTVFQPDDTLTVHNGKNSIFSVEIINGSTNFSNNDTLVIVPALNVNTTLGTFTVGDYVKDAAYGSNCEIIDIDTIAGSNNVVLYLRPRAVDLANASVNALAWTFGAQGTIQKSDDTVEGTIVSVYGFGAAGRVITNGIGKITTIFITDKGEDYQYLPTVTVKSTNNVAGISSLNLAARNYYDKIKVSTAIGSVGNGYAFGVSEGVIYQVGHFLRVDNQVVIVNAYSSSPNNVSAGFVTDEEIVNYTVDSSLTDNALGTENETAPGADRLKLTPRLVIANTEDVASNTEFLSLVEWNDGNPYKQNQVSIYSKIGDEMATRTDDAAGNFVIDPFLVTTASVANTSKEGNTFTVVVDPGEAYINGYKTKTTRNFKIDVPKATATFTSNVTISLNYDNYIRVNQLGGLFQFSTGDTVDLYDTAKTFLSNTALINAANTNPVGTKIGTARIRSLLLENGFPGDPTAVYRMYLFNVAMNSGKNFRSVRAIHYNNTNKGIADVILERDSTSGANIAILKETQNDTLVFKTGTDSIRNTNNVVYVYRTIDQTTTVANNTGLLSKSIAANPDEVYPYSPTLSDSDLRDLLVIPLANNLVAYTAMSGSVNVFTTSANLHGVGTSFLTTLEPGDYVKITGGAAENVIRKVVSVTNNTFATLDSNTSFANNGGALRRVFPQNVPVPFGRRSGLSANLNVAGTILTLNFGMTFEGTTNITTAVGCSIRRSGVTSTSKTVFRNRFVKIRLANNAGGVGGPWCLGVPEAMRLRNVYIGNSSVNSTAFPDVGSEFFIEPNHRANYADLSYLYLNPKSPITLTSSDYLLVKFDYFKRADDGYFDTVSYLHTSNSAAIANLDSLQLANLASDASTYEVPEFYNEKGQHFDLLNCMDFRPAVANTVDPNITEGSAPLNPVYTLSFGNTADPANDKKFPLPDSAISMTMEQYAGRSDVVIVGPDGNIVVQQGFPSVDPTRRYAPEVSADNLMLNKLKIPPYPNLSTNLSNNVVDIIDTSCHTNGKIGTRLAKHTIYTVVANSQTSVPTQPHRYTMANIGQLERRIQDLEYYQSLTLLETSITNKIIPSSVDGSLNRFKFGFTVDDFSTNIYSDRSNPQYAAEIEVADRSVDIVDSNTVPQMASNLCVPMKFRWSLKHQIGINLPYCDHKLLAQEGATVSLDPVQPGCIPTTNTTIVNTQVISVANSLIFASGVGSDTGNSNTMRRDPGAVMHSTFSSLSAPATLYFAFVYDPVVRVYQSRLPDYSNARLVIDTSSAVILSNTDRQYLLNDPQTATFWQRPYTMGASSYNGIPGSKGLNGLKDMDGAAGAAVAGSGKLSWTHDPSFGRHYYATITDMIFPNGSAPWGYFTMMRYPIDSITGGTTTICIIDPCGRTGTPAGYTGTAIAQYADNSSVIPDGTREFDEVIISCSGLLPLTRHNLYVNGVLNNTAVKPFGGRFGDPLLSDPFGKLKAVYYLPMTNWAAREAELGLARSPTTSNLILNEGQTFSDKFIGNAYQLFEILAPNSRAGAKLSYVPWTSY